MLIGHDTGNTRVSSHTHSNDGINELFIKSRLLEDCVFTVKAVTADAAVPMLSVLLVNLGVKPVNFSTMDSVQRNTDSDN